MFFSEFKHYSNRTDITLPYYFSGSQEPLMLTARLFDGQVYLSDNGRAYNELKKKAEGIAEKMTDYFACVCYELKLNDKKELVVPVNNDKDVFKLIQAISLISNAYMYPEVDEYYMEFHLPYREEAMELFETSAPKEFAERLFDDVQLDDKGEIIKLPFYFPDEPCPMWIRYSKSDMTLTDVGDFDGGKIIDRIDFHSGGEFCEDKVKELCKKFGCIYKEMKIYCKLENEEELSRKIFDFLKMASVLGETWYYIVL